MSIDHTEPVQPGLYLATDRLLVAAHAGFAAPVSWLQADQYNLKFKAFWSFVTCLEVLLHCEQALPSRWPS